MSYTEVHFLHKDPSQSLMLGEIKNAFRGAMYVWNHISKKYFQLDGFPMFDTEMQRKVWNAGNYKEVDEHDLFVLASTMDYATISANEVSHSIEMMRKFQEENPQSSIGEQADLIESCDLVDGCFAFRQTSVSEFWGLEYDDDKGEYIYRDPNGIDKCFCAANQTKSLLVD